MAKDVHGSWGAGTAATTSGGKSAKAVNPRTARGQGIGIGPVTKARTGAGEQSGGQVQRVGGLNLWSGQSVGKVSGVSGANRWDADF